MNKKKKIVLVVIIVSILLLGVGIYLSSGNDNNKTKIFDNDNNERFNIMDDLSYFYIDTFLVEKGLSTCKVSFRVNRREIVDFDYNSTDIYLLDEKNNLVYSLEGKTIGQGGFEDPSMTYFMYNTETVYDISSAVRAELSSAKSPYKYNKDIKYIRVLGFNNTGQEYLNRIKKELTIPLIVNSKNYLDLLEIETRSEKIYNLITNNKEKTITQKKTYSNIE